MSEDLFKVKIPFLGRLGETHGDMISESVMEGEIQKKRGDGQAPGWDSRKAEGHGQP